MRKTALLQSKVPLLALIVVGSWLLLVLGVFSRSCVERQEDDPFYAVDELVDAFVNADAQRAKSVTIPEQWERIEKLMEGRKAFKCRRGDWDSTGMSGVCGGDPEQGEVNCSSVYQCASQRTPFCFSVDDALVRKSEDGWKVHDWKERHEAFDYAYRCAEVPPLREP
jgi:hypothetical protein